MQPDDAATMPDTQPSQRDAFFKELEQRIGRRNFELWFHNKTTVGISGNRVDVGVGSSFLLIWMQKRFGNAIDEAAGDVLQGPARIAYHVDMRLPAGVRQHAPVQPRPKTRKPVGGAPDSVKSKTTAASPTAPRPGRRFADLTDFVIGNCNELAMTAARQICDSPGSRFNPLLLHGGVGTGKSHLLEGIYKSIKRRHPSLQAMFLTAEAFTNYFTQACRDHTLPSFRQRFRNVDVLLVDDIDFLDGKRAIQEEFLHTFNQLDCYGRQLVLTADRHPRLLRRLREELSTRCLSGLVCRIESPDYETRRRIVEHRATRMQAEFAPEALAYVAERFPHNVRELLGALNCLETYYSMTRRRVSRAAARRVLSELERDCVRVVRMGDIDRAVCDFFRIDPDDLKSSRRSRSVSQPRMLAMFLVRKHTQAAYSEIGQYFGGRNHSTVMSAERRIKKLIKDQVTLKIASQTWPVGEVLETLEQQLYAS